MIDDVEDIVITGAGGNIGRKLVEYLASDSRCKKIYAIDSNWNESGRFCIEDQKIDKIDADLLYFDAEWAHIVKNVDAVVHLAAQNPHTDATWADAAASVEITANLVSAASLGKMDRFIFASTNHVMGGYKDECTFLEQGWLQADLDPKPGTIWNNGTQPADSTIYASGKLMCERLLRSMSVANSFLGIVVRIGWVQPDVNDPETLSIAGDPKYNGLVSPQTEEDHHTLRWFRSMWLSNRDLRTLFQGALWFPIEKRSAATIVVNGMSANTGMPWDISSAEEFLGYVAQDNCFRKLTYI